MAICAVLCGADDWVEVADWCEGEGNGSKDFLTSRMAHPRMTPLATFSACWIRTSSESCFREWIGGLVGVVKRHHRAGRQDGARIEGRIDPALPSGRCLRHSLGLTLGQEGSAGKGNELKAVRALLDTLVLMVASSPSMLSDVRPTLRLLIVDKGGDYVLAVKANQKTLSEALAESFETGDTLGWGSADVQHQTTVEKDHGRIETRRAVLVFQIDWLPDAIRKRVADVGAVGMIETTQEKGTTVSTDRRYFIASRWRHQGRRFQPGGPGALGHRVDALGARRPFGKTRVPVRKDQAARNLPCTQNHLRHAPPRYRLPQKAAFASVEPAAKKTSLPRRPPRPSPAQS